MIHMLSKICPHCSKSYKTYRVDAKYCSLNCVAKAKAERTGTLGERLKKYSLAKDTGCIEWTGNRMRKGYGILKFRYHPLANEYGNVLVHRAAYFEAHGEIPKGLFVCHKCDNPPCINPDHLFLGTHQDNDQDKINKGRHPKGSNTYNAKLNEEQVSIIKRRYLDGEKQVPLAKEFGVPRSTIDNLVRGKTWKHIQPASRQNALEDYVNGL